MVGILLEYGKRTLFVLFLPTNAEQQTDGARQLGFVLLSECANALHGGCALLELGRPLLRVFEQEEFLECFAELAVNIDRAEQRTEDK